MPIRIRCHAKGARLLLLIYLAGVRLESLLHSQASYTAL